MAKIEGLNKVLKNFDKVMDRLIDEAEEGLEEIGQEMRTTSNRIAPKDTGNLRDSAYVETEKSKGYAQVEVGYDDTQAPYAVEMHEYINRQGGRSFLAPTTPGTEPQFLKKARNRKEKEILGEMEDHLKGLF